MNENKYERSYREHLASSTMEQYITRVDNSYISFLDSIGHNMRHIFPDSFSWEESISHYYASDEYRHQKHIIYNVDDIEEITFDDIKNWISEEEQYQNNLNALEEINGLLNSDKEGRVLSDEQYLAFIYRAFDILGICKLESGNRPLFPNLMEPFTDLQSFTERVMLNRETAGIPGVLVSAFCRLFQPGLRFSFPQVGTVMTQRKGQCFYRGENAWYGSSKASAFRGKAWSEFAPDWAYLGWKLRMDECGCFFDQFDAVKKWNYGEVNYLALAQHYGLRTPMMDITSNLKTALFFACCKWGEDKKWHPLSEEDFKEKDSRESVARLHGDSRYGILYRVPTEVLDYKWASHQREQTSEMIIPIGYQPFMRCSTQYGYMIFTDENFDLLRETLFNKYRFRLNSEICQWIFEEMEQGNLIYPKDRDIPDISGYVEGMNQRSVFSKKNIDNIVKELMKEGYLLGKGQISQFYRQLEVQGIQVKNEVEIIPSGKLKRMNGKYTVEKAYGYVGRVPLDSPLLVMAGDVMM